VFRQGKTKTTSSKVPVVIPDVILPLLTAWLEQNQTAPEDAADLPDQARHTDAPGELAAPGSASDCQGFRHYGADKLSDVTPDS
jgi:hypothetical protein